MMGAQTTPDLNVDVIRDQERPPITSKHDGKGRFRPSTPSYPNHHHLQPRNPTTHCPPPVHHHLTTSTPPTDPNGPLSCENVMGRLVFDHPRPHLHHYPPFSLKRTLTPNQHLPTTTSRCQHHPWTQTAPCCMKI